MTITELIELLDGYGLCVTDDDEIAERLFSLNLAPQDKLSAVDKWASTERA